MLPFPAEGEFCPQCCFVHKGFTAGMLDLHHVANVEINAQVSSFI